MRSSLYQIQYAVFTGTTNDTNLNDVKGCQKSSASITFAKIYQEVLAHTLIFTRNATHCILGYDIRRSVRSCARVCACVCIYVCMCVCLFVRLNASFVDRMKMVCDK